MSGERSCWWCGRPHSRKSEYCSEECKRWSEIAEPIRGDIEQIPDPVKKLFWDIMHGDYFDNVRARNPRDFAATCLRIASTIAQYPVSSEEVARVGNVKMSIIRKFKNKNVLSPVNYAELVKLLCERKGYGHLADEIYNILSKEPIKGSPSIRSVAAAMVVLLCELKGIRVLRRKVAGDFGVSEVSLRKWVKKLRPDVESYLPS